MPKGSRFCVRVSGLTAPRAAVNSTIELRLVEASSIRAAIKSKWSVAIFLNQTFESARVSGLEVVSGLLANAQVLLDDARPAMGVKLTVLFNPSARNTFILTDVLDLELGAFMEFDDSSTLAAVLHTPLSKTRALHARRVGGGVVTLWGGGGAEYTPQLHSNHTEGVGAYTGVKIVVEGLRNRKDAGSSGDFRLRVFSRDKRLVDQSSMRAVDIRPNRNAAPFYPCPNNSYRQLTEHLGVDFQECLPCHLNAWSPAGSLTPLDCSCNAGYSPSATPVSTNELELKQLIEAVSVSCQVSADAAIDKTTYSAAVLTRRLLQANDVSCGGGQEPRGDACEPCEPCEFGYYKTLADNSSCVQCPSNSTTSLAGTLLLKDCVCIAGYAGVLRASVCNATGCNMTEDNTLCEPCSVCTYKASI